MAKDTKIVLVIAELEIHSAMTTETVRVKTFDKAWHKALTMPTPVSIRFVGFTRAD